jgi:hypothetical protein
MSINVRKKEKALFNHLPLKARKRCHPEHPMMEVHLILEPENPRPFDANTNCTKSQLQPIRERLQADQDKKEGRRSTSQDQELLTLVIVPPEFALARPVGAREETMWPEEELGRLLLRGRPAERRALDDT